MKRILILAAAVLLSTLAVGVATAQEDQAASAQEGTDDVTFYGHVFGHGLPAPQASNTEAPIGEDNYGLGSYEVCTPVVWVHNGDLVNEGDCEDSRWNKLALFSTAGFVDVNSRAEFDNEGGYGLLHNERGQTKDIRLDTSESITATLFGTVDFHGWAVGGQPYGTNCIYDHPPGVPCAYPYWGWDAGAQPGFSVEATLLQANLGDRSESAAAPPVEQALQSGDAEIVAQGTWGPETVMNGLPNAAHALQFDIDLGSPETDTIAKENDFFIVYRVYSDTAAGDVSPTTFRWWSGEFFAPSYTLPVENAFEVERVIPNFANGKLALLGIMNTPWGSYDVDANSVELNIEGPDGSITPTQIERYSDFSVAHGGHYDPVNVTWIWDYRNEGISPGEYTVTVSASNFQNSASADCRATFTIEEGASRLEPGEVQEGVCGAQTASDEFVEDIREGSEEQAGGS